MSSNVDYSDLPALIPNIPMEMYYGDDEEEITNTNKYDNVEYDNVEYENVEYEGIEYEGIEITDYIDDFLDNQNNYFHLMKSYCIGNYLEIYITDSKKKVLSAGFLTYDNKVHELRRDKSNVDNTYDSVWKWVNNYYGKVVSKKKLVNNIYIGENFVSLGCILVDAYEEDNNYIVSLPEKEPMNDRVAYPYISIVIVGILIVAFLLMINLI